MFRVLEIGASSKPLAPDVYNEETVGQEVEYTYLDADKEAKFVTVLHELAYPDSPLPFKDNTFDALCASHVLEHIPYYFELVAIEDWKRVLKPGGTMNIIVPSWEYVARVVLSETPDAHVKPFAFGALDTPWNIHTNMFTMQMLRAIFAHCGLDVVRARTGPREIVSFGEKYVAEQHYIAGVKRGE